MSSDVASLRRLVATEWQRIMARHRYARDGVYVAGLEIMQEHTRLADTVVRRIHGAARDEGQLRDDTPLTIVALGGYGREELNPHSDIDIMVLYEPQRCPKAVLEPFANRLITHLWDVGYEVGHSVRTLRECRQAAARDMDSRTAMLEGRFVVGHTSLYRHFEREIKTRAVRRGVRLFIQEKIDEWRADMGDPSATVYVQEPDLKTGVGGLREVHIARWVGRTRFGVWETTELSRSKMLPQNAVEDYEKALDFLWRVRNELHYLSSRRTDRLTFDVQEKVALGLGYPDHTHVLAEEQLMRDYFRHAHWIHECARIIIMQSRWEASWWRNLTDRMTARHVTPHVYVLRDRLRLTPSALTRAIANGSGERLLMEFFQQRAATGLPPNVMTRHQIVSELSALAGGLEESAEVRRMFLNMLEADNHVGEALRDMFHLGVLGILLPEFEPLRALVRYDLFHRYTVDEHTFFAISNVDVERMGDTHLGQALLEVHEALEPEDRVSLRLALILHDIGKGVPGDSGHVERGARQCADIVGRFETLAEQQHDDVLFLVEQHLLMSHTAQRRDLDDPAIIERFATSVGSLRRVRLLYLLTHADIRAVSLDLWTDWTAALLLKLYAQSARYFRGELRRYPEELDRMCDQAIAELGAEWQGDVRQHVDMMGRERMAFYTVEELAAHVRAVRTLDEDGPCAFQVFGESENYSSVVLTARDRIGLFAQVAGTLSAVDVNILGADLNTRKDGIVVDTLHVAAAATGRGIDRDTGERIQRLLNDVGTQRTTVEELLAHQPRREQRHTPHRTIRKAPSVRINNDDSREYTIIDVRAYDRVGVLYAVSNTLSKLGLNISLARISTEAYRAVDVFYVADENGEKVTEPARVQEICATMTRALED